MLLRLARQLFDVVTYPPARPTTVTPARIVYLTGGRTRTVRDRRRRTHNKLTPATLETSRGLTGGAISDDRTV